MNARTSLVIGTLGVALVGGACSLANDPGDPIPPEGAGGAVPVGPGTGGTGGDATTTAQGGSGGVVMPECTVDEDCDMFNDECNDGVCNVDTCEAQPKAEGTPCGDATEDVCNGADTCDAAGVCQPNHQPNGTYCDACPAGAGLCTGCLDGVCGDCTAFASVQNFARQSSIAGWVTTGDWRLYRYAPISQNDTTEVDFGKYVFGTDGNNSQPYPGSGEVETSSAITTPFTMPASVEFQSWHVDEGGGTFDRKAIDVSTDGGTTWQPFYECGTGPALPFCNGFFGPRPATQWDAISIPVPGGLVGQTVQLRFRYDTVDAAGGFERGWFIDALNVATDCGCTDDSACAYVEAEDSCGVGTCDMTTNTCVVGAANEGMPCGDPMEMTTDCDQLDACKTGYCDAQIALTDVMCSDCANTSMDACLGCTGGGECRDCRYQNFFSSVDDLTGWTLTGDWGRYTTAPVSQTYTSVVNFGSMFGTDGNRSFPYPGPGELENSTATSPTFAVPDQITFVSWHVDEAFDHKGVFLSVDGGTTWIALADCTAAAPLNEFPFCQTVNQDRPANPKDSIVLDTSLYQGMQGILQFRYNTNDDCCQFERGWYIDNLNVGRECY